MKLRHVGLECLLYVPLLVFLAMLSTGQAQTSGLAGVALVRDRAGQSDEFAKAIPFQRMAPFTVVTNFYTSAAAPIIVENNRLAVIVTFDEIDTRDLIDDADKGFLQHKQDEIRQASQRFPAARVTVNPVFQDISASLLQMTNGNVRYRGSWVSSTSYQAMVARQREEAEKDRKRLQASADDRKQREANLTASRQNLASQWLLKDFKNYVADLEKVPAGGAASISIPSTLLNGVLPLPRTRFGEAVLKEGRTASAPAMLFVSQQEKCTSFRLAFTVLYEDDRIVNPGEMQAAVNVLSQLDSGMAGWLPLAVVSGQTRLAFLKNGSRKMEPVHIGREVAAMTCNLTVTPESVTEDGSVYSVVCLTVR